MMALIRLLLALLATPFHSKSSLEAENAALCQQIIVLRRKLRGRVTGISSYGSIGCFRRSAAILDH